MTTDPAASAATGAGSTPGGLTTHAGHWRLDPRASKVEFSVPHFWHAIKVRGSFGQLSGQGTVTPDGSVTGQIVMDAASLDTRNKQRDKHLRSADFFNSDEHPQVVLAVTQATATPDGRLAMVGTLQAAGVEQPVSFTADLVEAGNDAVTLRAELTVDRSRYGMTWSPMKMTAMQATGSVTARFIRDAGGVASS
jgi:polyisoprenoid-binding protein YceI